MVQYRRRDLNESWFDWTRDERPTFTHPKCEWRIKPEPAIPWDSVPEWLEWWAVDADGEQWFIQEKPEAGGCMWSIRGGGWLRLPESHRITYTGDWRESLRQRPGKEAKQ